jgi:hypothetical protein
MPVHDLGEHDLMVASATATDEVTPWTHPWAIRVSKSEQSSESAGVLTRW